jgi:hypothetical protein
MSFKKSKQKSQPDLFATAMFSLPERERRYMEDELSWHNEFYRNVLLNIDEEILRPLFVDGNMGAPTKQLRILIAIRILKEGRGCSDEQLYEKALDFLAEDASKTVYRSDDETLGQRLLDLGIVISHILSMRGEGEVSLLSRVFHEQYDVDKDGNISVRDKKLVSATSVQNPNDPDAAYRSKGARR